MASRKAFLLRIDPVLWNALERWASDELRSVNGQIEYLLGRAARDAGRLGTGKARMPLRHPADPAGGSHRLSGSADPDGPRDPHDPPDPASPPADPDDLPEAPAR